MSKEIIKLDSIRKTIILEDIGLINIESNEVERSIALIDELIKAVISSLIKSGHKASFKAQNIYYDGSKKDFITDFELFSDSKLFHIIEAKGSTGLAGAKEQIRQQLINTNCNSGCITDGFNWQFVTLNKDQSLDFVGGPLFLQIQIDLIFDKIIQSIFN